MKGLLLVVFKKASAFAGVFFVSALYVATVLYALPTQAKQCQLDKRSGSNQRVRLDYVVDGDTVRLKDGRKVRLVSINAPEIEQEDKAGEPYGELARQTLIKLVGRQKELLMQVVGKDHYGRTLGHLFTSQGSLLSASLLNQGLAYQIFMEATDAYTECLKAEEAAARYKQLGLWKQKAVYTKEKTDIHSGFMLIRGTVKKISKPKKSKYVWLEMDGDVVLRVSKQIATQQWLSQVKDQKIEVRGWIIDRSDSENNSKHNNKKSLNKHSKRRMMLIYQTDSVGIGW